MYIEGTRRMAQDAWTRRMAQDAGLKDIKDCALTNEVRNRVQLRQDELGEAKSRERSESGIT